MSSRLSFAACSRAGGPTDYHGRFSNGNLAYTARGPYTSLAALTDALAAEIAAATQSSIPECTTCELSLDLNATLPLIRPTIGPYAQGQPNDIPHEFKHAPTVPDGADPSKVHPGATCATIVNITDPSGRAIVQRAASRGVIQAVEAADGYRYSFNNAWTAKDEEGSRFSFICQDSMQNKDRHANGFTRTTKHLKGETNEVRGPRKPTYDCKGSVSVKFSSGKQSVDVYYRHYAIHQTVAERKLPPRPPPRSKEAGAATQSTPKEGGGLLPTLQAETFANTALAMVNDQRPIIDNQPPLAMRSHAGPSISRPLKRKRESLPPPPPAPKPRDPNKPPSLSELLASSETANKPASPVEALRAVPSKFPPPVAYELPSWQTPPPPMTATPSNQPYPPPYPPYPPPGKIAISATPRQGPLSQQSRPGAPTGTPGSGHALFTTMKQVWQQPQTPVFHSFGPQRQRGSKACSNCRQRKTRCDEAKPCGACVKSGRTDCYSIEQPPAPESTPRREDFAGTWGSLSQPGPPPQLKEWQQQQQQSQANSPWPAAQQQPPQPQATTAARRDDSPDPWYPKR